jgi:hypothetical protein
LARDVLPAAAESHASAIAGDRPPALTLTTSETSSRISSYARALRSKKRFANATTKTQLLLISASAQLHPCEVGTCYLALTRQPDGQIEGYAVVGFPVMPSNYSGFGSVTALGCGSGEANEDHFVRLDIGPVRAVEVKTDSSERVFLHQRGPDIFPLGQSSPREFLHAFATPQPCGRLRGKLLPIVIARAFLSSASSEVRTTAPCVPVTPLRFDNRSATSAARRLASRRRRSRVMRAPCAHASRLLPDGGVWDAPST